MIVIEMIVYTEKNTFICNNGFVAQYFSFIEYSYLLRIMEINKGINK